MIKNVFILSFYFLSLTSVLFSQEVIKVGIFDLKPHLYKNTATNQPAGASIAYFTKVATEMKYKVNWIGPLPLPRLIEMLKYGKVDATLMMTKNPEREGFLYYPDSPYFPVKSILIVKRENTLNKITKIDDIKGLRIGYFTGANMTPFIKDNLNSINMDLISGQDWALRNYQKLFSNRIDAIYDLNDVTLVYEAKLLNYSDKIKMLYLPDPPRYVYVAFSKKSPIGKQLLDEYNALNNSGKITYDKFLVPYK